MVDGKKMSKSLWNFYTLRDIEAKYKDDPRLYRAIRLGFINGKYRDQINFSFEKLEQNMKTLKNIEESCRRLTRYTAEYSWVRPEFREELQTFMADFIAALEDDFSFPEAFGVFFAFQKYISGELVNSSLTSDEQASAVDMYLSFDEIFRILDVANFEVGEQEIPENIIELAEKRDQAKSDKNYELSDTIRDEIVAEWYTVIDTKEGTKIEKN